MKRFYKISLAIIAIEIIALCSILIYSKNYFNDQQVVEESNFKDITIPTKDELSLLKSDIIPDGKGGTQSRENNTPDEKNQNNIDTNSEVSNDSQVTPEQTKPNYIYSNDGHSRWNEPKQCWDESNFAYQFIDVPYNNSGAYDPNWLVCDTMNNGCLFCFHPNQGHENGPVDSKE